jgi:hypothetical protein
MNHDLGKWSPETTEKTGHLRKALYVGKNQKSMNTTNKKIILAGILSFFSATIHAQQESGILPPSGAKFETYTDWKKVTVSFDGGGTATYEYRIALMKRKSLACNYDLQIKNTSTEKLKFKVNTHYYDRLVKSNFGDKFDEKIKPGATTSFIILTQGCKEDKDKKNQEDYERCMSCGLSYEIQVIKD